MLAGVKGPMKSENFHNADHPLKVVVELAETGSGGRHRPVVPGENWRPDMYLIGSGRQFWGQIDFEDLAYPGSTQEGWLYASYPEDLSNQLVSGAKIRLISGAQDVGIATIW
ncbi:hypothetical protein [Marinobacter sp. W-8]|uniref:hypothetical protein n=1 Tax=Marinobacter sp. W-8 TaxID=3369658 RepID=UPI0037CC65FE